MANGKKKAEESGVEESAAEPGSPQTGEAVLSPYEQLVSDINAIVDDPKETDAPRMLRRIIERVRNR